MIGKWGFSLLPFYLGIIPIFANNNYTLTRPNLHFTLYLFVNQGVPDSFSFSYYLFCSSFINVLQSFFAIFFEIFSVFTRREIYES